MEIIKLNLIPSGVNPTCHCSQYDNGRVIRIDLFDGLTPYVLQSGDTVTLNVRKPDNTIIETSLTATQGNTYVNLVTTEQMCACVGYNLCDLTITNGSVEIGTLNFIMQVERDVLADGIPSQSVIEDLDALVQEAVGDQYYTKSDTDALLDNKADKSTTYTKTETDNLLAQKATKEQVDYNFSYNQDNDNEIISNINALLGSRSNITENNRLYLYKGGYLNGEPYDSDYYVRTDFIDNSAENNFTFYYDSSVYAINIQRFNANKEYIGQTTFLTIQPIRIRAYITDPYILIEIKRIDNAVINRKDVSIYSKKTTQNNIAYLSDLSEIEKITTIKVKKDGSGDYSTLKAAIAAITNPSIYNRYIIEIYEGEYDLKSEYASEWGTSGFIGCTVPPFTRLKGVGNKNNIILKAEDTETSQDIRILMSTINLYQSSEMENLTIKGEGLKYTVHDDFDSNKYEGFREFRDIVVLGDQPLTASIWGAGVWGNTKTRFVNCLFSSNNKVTPVYIHTNTSAVYPSFVEFINCRFKSYNLSFGDCRLFLSSPANAKNTKAFCTIIGTKVRTIYMSTEGSGNSINWFVNGFGNETNGASIQTTGFDDNVDLIGTSQYSRYSDGAY